MIDAGTILEITRKLIGDTEPYGDSAIDRERTQNLDNLIYIVDELLYDVEKVARNKDRHEGSMRMMGEKAHKALNDYWSWLEEYMRGNKMSKDIIYRQAAIDALLDKGQASRRYKLGETWELNLDEITEAIGSVPPAQPEIIRCRDCRWRQDQSGSTAWVPCRAIVTPSDFSCSRAERREE